MPLIGPPPLGTYVGVAGDETITGSKTFSSAPVVPDASFTPAKMAGQFAPQANRTVFLGDSLTIGNSVSDTSRGQRDHGMWASLLSDSRIVYGRNAGIGGNTSAQVLARVTADIGGRGAGVCVLQIGTNDAYNAVSTATYIANVQAIVASIRALSIMPVLCTIPPRSVASTSGGSSNTLIRIGEWNAWLRRYAALSGIVLIDTYSAWIDPTTGDPLTQMVQSDGIHQTEEGAKAIGQVIADTLGPLLPAWTPPLANHQATHSPNKVTNALFLTDTDVDGSADGWTKSLGSGVASIVTGDPAIMGNWQRITNATATNANLLWTLTGWSVGDTLAVCGRITLDQDDLSGWSEVRVLRNGVDYFWPVFQHSVVPYSALSKSDVTNNIFYGEFVVSSGTTSLLLYLTKALGNGSAGGFMQVAQITVLNLTTGAILTPA